MASCMIQVFFNLIHRTRRSMDTSTRSWCGGCLNLTAQPHSVLTYPHVCPNYRVPNCPLKGIWFGERRTHADTRYRASGETVLRSQIKQDPVDGRHYRSQYLGWFTGGRAIRKGRDTTS